MIDWLKLEDTWTDIHNFYGRLYIEEVILHLVETKYLINLLYGLDCYPFNTADTRSLDFEAHTFLMKMFRTVNMDVINECRFYFDFILPSELLVKRKSNFFAEVCSSIVCHFGFAKCVKCVRQLFIFFIKVN